MPNGNFIFCEGDSLTVGTGGGTNGDYPYQMKALAVGATVQNNGSSGALVATIESQAATTDSIKVSQGFTTSIIVVLIGTNDLAAGTAGGTVEADIAAYCADRQAAGWKVAVCSIFDRQDAGLVAGWATEQGVCNAALAANWATYADAFIDLASDGRLNDATDTTYFGADKLHLKAAGYAVVAELVYAGIDALMEAPLTGDNPVGEPEVGYQTIQPLAFPDFRGPWLVGADAGLVIDAASEAGALMKQAERTDTITNVVFTIRGHTTGATLDIRLETIDAANGLPSGSLLAAGASGTVTTTGTGRYNCTIGTPPSVTRGDRFAIVISQPAASFGNCALNSRAMAIVTSFPHSAQRIGGAGWARNSTFQLCAQEVYGTAGTVPMLGGDNFVDDTAFTFNTGSTPDERGNRFALPFRCRVRGVTLRTGTATGNLVVRLYDANDNVLATTTMDNNDISVTNSAVTTILFPTSHEFAENAVFRIAVQSDSASNVIIFQTSYVAASGDLQALVVSGHVQSTFRTDAGAWSDSENGLVWLGALIDGVHLADYPDEADVANGVLYDDGNLEGTLSVGGGGGGGGRIIGVNC